MGVGGGGVGVGGVVGVGGRGVGVGGGGTGVRVGGGGSVGSGGDVLSTFRQVNDQESLLGLIAMPLGFPSASTSVCRITCTDQKNLPLSDRSKR